MLIKKVCKANADVFTEKKQKVFDRLFLYIFYPCLDSFAQSGEFDPWEILFMENVIKSRDFYSLKILPGLVQKILSRVYTFIHCIYFYPVQRLLSSAQIFIQCRVFIKCADFYLGKPSAHIFLLCRDFDPVHRSLSSVEIFTQCIYFYPVNRFLTSAQIFIQCTDFYSVRRFLLSPQTVIQCAYFYPVHRF